MANRDNVNKMAHTVLTVLRGQDGEAVTTTI